MSQKIARKAFRSAFQSLSKDVVRWFPGHMGRGLKQMQNKLKLVDCVIEVHDARIPFSGRNTNFKYTISGIKPHVLVMNKADLITPEAAAKISEKFGKEEVIFTNCKNERCKGVQKIFPLAQTLINNSDRYNRSNEEDFCIMVIGIPNVGKSSLLNVLRNRILHKAKASAVGAKPGITRNVLYKIKICEKPLVYMLDTPGILTPNIDNVEVGLKLALCATIEDHLVGEGILADYLLYWLNKQNLFDYVDLFKLKEPTDEILHVLTQISLNENKILKVKDTNNNYVFRPDFDLAAKFMLKAFRTGALGKIMLDNDIIKP